MLSRNEKLDKKYKDHELLGVYKDLRECHIKADWILVYTIDDEEIELILFRTGKHSDVFTKFK